MKRDGITESVAELHKSPAVQSVQHTRHQCRKKNVTELHSVTELQTQREGFTESMTELHKIKRDGITQRDGFTQRP